MYSDLNNMAKKTKKAIKENNQCERTTSYEKIKDELFQYRVEIQSYKRSMNMLWICVSIVLSILTFFGYNKIEVLLDEVKQTANEKLAETEQLLSKINTHYLDSLTTIVEERTIAYEEAIAALEKGTKVNNELYKKLISGLPYNKRIAAEFEPYIEKDATNLFDIVFYSDHYISGQTGECYVVMGDEYSPEKDDVFFIEVMPNNRRVIIYYQTYEVLRNYNKFHFKFDKYEQSNDYNLVIALQRKQGKETIRYTISKPIAIH